MIHNALSRRVAMLGTILKVVEIARAAGSEMFYGAKILIVRSSRLPAYDEALEGMRGVLAIYDLQSTYIDLEEPGSATRLAGCLEEKPRLIVAVGSGAADAVLARDGSVSVVVTMVLSTPSSAAASRRSVSTVSLELPGAVILPKLKQLYPKRLRLAIVRGPAMTAATASRLHSTARSHGYEPQVIECPGAKDLLKAVGDLQNRADFVWCLPDGELYQGTTITAVILAAMRAHLPLIGFSEGFVRAGALVGFYPDYRDIGRQTADTAIRQLQGHASVSLEPPRRARAAINQRVMHILGIEHVEVEGTVLLR